MWKWNTRDPFVENWYYHIYNRWFNKVTIFNNRLCFERFYWIIIKYLKEYEHIKMVSYSFLPNHFHFIIRNGENGTGTQISEFMKKIQWAYCRWHRIKFPLDIGTKLPFFEWRFKAKYIETDQYLEQCLAYVNFNPLKHNLVENIQDYKWTSYHQLDTHKISKYKDLILSELEF